MLAAALALLYGCQKPSQPAEGTKLFAKICSGCHGADAHGTDQGPALAGDRTLRWHSIPQLRKRGGAVTPFADLLFLFCYYAITDVSGSANYCSDIQFANCIRELRTDSASLSYEHVSGAISAHAQSLREPSAAA